MVTVNEFLDPDVDIYYLVGKALRYVRVHNIFALFFFFSIGQFQEESENTSKSRKSRKERNTLTTSNKVRWFTFVYNKLVI